MHPLNTERRRRLLAASLRLERTLKRSQRSAARDQQETIARLQRGGKRWDDTPL